MLFRAAALLSALVASATAHSMIPDDFDIKADSKFGMKLLSLAQSINEDENSATVETRNLENNKQDYSWVANYSIKYQSCASLVQIGDGEGNKNNNDGGGTMYTQNLVKFSLCPTAEGCDACKTGEAQYVVNMADFIDAYTEAKMEEQEYACEIIRENCYCDNYNDDQVCENACYVTAEMESCIEIEGGDEFEIQRYLECAGKCEILETLSFVRIALFLPPLFPSGSVRDDI
jgi:hypothetical protein